MNIMFHVFVYPLPIFEVSSTSRTAGEAVFVGYLIPLLAQALIFGIT